MSDSCNSVKEVHANFYDEEFYRNQVNSSYISAHVYLKRLWEYIAPSSVVDVGCGRGAWLKACHELGCSDLIGLDGFWNSQNKMMDGCIKFSAIDLNQPFEFSGRVDLAMSLEVAEHLFPESSENFVKSLVGCADVVLFGAACVGQGGTNHINEQPASYWAELFMRFDYVVFDLFRPVLWGNQEVKFWYRQNAFLYVKKDSESYMRLLELGERPMIDTPFMDCIHPDLYASKPVPEMGFMFHAKSLIPSFFKGLKKRMQPAG